jgi:hypothetical protein
MRNYGCLYQVILGFLFLKIAKLHVYLAYKSYDYS